MSFSVSEYKYLIQPGYMYITENATSIYGVTGSGVFIGLFDEKNKYSGCCSYLYPSPPNTKVLSTKYGSIAIKHLIKKMKNKGSSVEDLKAHLIGGSDSETSNDYGQKNINIAETILNYFTIEILSSDTGGKIGRKFIYDTESGHSLTFKTEKIRKSDWYPYEKRKTG
ncbi:MAG: chemotaxis protein CheD [Candidatus Cloacimonetes bacterium]|nr:chemotaxis protein CheD [Candidatus Cloacimonadota bacterium]